MDIEIHAVPPRLTPAAQRTLQALVDAGCPMETSKTARPGILSGASAAGLERKGLVRYVYPIRPTGQAHVEITDRGRWALDGQ